MKIAEGLEVLVIAPSNGGPPYHPSALYDERSVVLVDAGLPDFLDLIVAAMQDAGLSPDRLQAIVFTHNDLDPIGSLPHFPAAPGGDRLDVYVHEADKDVVNGHRPMIKVPADRVDMILGTIPADAMVVQGDQLMGPNPGFTPNMNEALRPLGKLAAYDIETVVCFHGGIYRGQENERIAELAAQAQAD
ncbi:MBL fold metallo-hydrolase [Cohnella suwonensis]|uniref:MBL fold metallo-hydrolase n=1 Tax=Cohnella suwonensis TaxID=696072 RepID=A0ABW0LNH2_9BACL